LSTLRALRAAGRVANMPFVALLLSAVYPAVFLLSLNWYALRAERMAFVILTPVVVAVTAYLLIRFAVWSLFACVRALGGSSKYAEWKTSASLLLVGLACSAIFFFFMYGTLQKLFKTDTLLLVCFLALFALTVWLALNRRLRYWTALLSIMTVISLVTWAESVVAATMEAAAEERRLIHSPLKGVKFKDRPNIYLIVYDGYGNKRLHREIFGVDNAAIYQELAVRNFKVLNTYSNYWGTWDSMLSVFLADHHYYDMTVGVYDSRIGRWIMNGTTFNPVLSVLKDNGYNVQYIEATNYLVKNRGNLDYVYPDVSGEPVYIGLRVFNNPLLDRLPSVKVAGAKPNTLVGYVNTMTEVLFKRLRQTIKGGTPWFTYIHFPLPAHAGGPFRSLRSWEDEYRENTRKANAHMPPTIDRILAIDPGALIIIMGDHGSYRYSEAWEGADNPNDAFKVNGLDSDVMALDYFGILMALRSRGQCDDFIYENMTPVNLMRVIFSCLSGDRELLKGRAVDISIFPHGLSGTVYVASGIYMTVKDGKILKPWIKMQRK
jgi:hypothetical protein